MPPCHCESRDFSQDTSSATLVDPWLENPSQSAKPPTGGTGWFSHQAGRDYNGAMPGGLPSLNMTLRTNTLLSLLSLLSLLATVSAHPGGYWWMGQDGAFGSQSNNNQIVDNSPSPSPSPALELVPGGGYYGSSNQPTEDFSSSSSSAGSLEDLTPSPSLPVVFEG